MARKISIVYEGRTIPGLAMEFKTVKNDDWAEFRLEDGGTVRIRLVVSEIVKTKEKTPDGQPLVVVRSMMLVAHEEARKKGQGRKNATPSRKRK